MVTAASDCHDPPELKAMARFGSKITHVGFGNPFRDGHHFNCVTGSAVYDILEQAEVWKVYLGECTGTRKNLPGRKSGRVQRSQWLE